MHVLGMIAAVALVLTGAAFYAAGVVGGAYTVAAYAYLIFEWGVIIKGHMLIDCLIASAAALVVGYAHIQAAAFVMGIVGDDDE